jgi:hypothetical protein
MKDYLMHKVMADIDDISNYAADNPERIVLEEFQIIDDVKQQRECRKFGVMNFYELSLTKCVNNLYKTTEELESASQSDLIVYLMVLYVANLISYTNLVDFRTSTLPPTLDQVLMMSRQ